MSLPFELTTFPKGALDIIRYLASLDSYAAYDTEIIDAAGLSERAFGKAIRRLVTKEYVEMQYDGTYALTQVGVEASEAIAAHDDETMHDAAVDDEAFELDEESIAEPVARTVMVIFPRTLVANQPNFVFVRVDEAEDEGSDLPVDVLFRAGGDCDTFPEQTDTSVPPVAPAEAVRFEVTPPGEGDFGMTIEALQVTQTDLTEAGSLEFTLTATNGPAARTFRVEAFEIELQPGL